MTDTTESDAPYSEDATAFIRALLNAWDCCGTCAGGVLAKRDRERDDALRTVRPVNGYACHHCGKLPDRDGDHSCPCPYTDATCPNHPARVIPPGEGRDDDEKGTV